MSIREQRSIFWLPAAICAVSSLACDAPPTDLEATPESPPARAETKTLAAAEPADAAAEAKVRSLLAERLGQPGKGQSAVAEGLVRGDFQISFERLRTPLIDELLPAVEVFVATLQRRVPDSTVIAVDPAGQVFALPSELDALLRSGDVSLDGEAAVLKLAQLYVSLSSPSALVLFPRSWQDVPPPAAGQARGASPQDHAADIRGAEVAETPAFWKIAFTSWEQSQGRLARWTLTIDKREGTIAGESELLARRVGDYVADAFY